MTPPSPLWMPLLAPLGLLYRVLTALRRAGYALGWLRAERAACPVISVGNLTVGGSGKTPLVDWLLRAAQEAGCRPVAISRGYRNRTEADVMRVRLADCGPSAGGGPDPAALGDEPTLLARRNPQVPVYVARRRVQAARLAAAWDAPGLIVLDDGFQHLRLARDLDVVLVDAQRGLGNGRLLPLGPLREPLRAARRAHAVLISKASLGDAEALRARIRTALGPAVPIFTSDYRPVRLRRLDGGAELAPEALHGVEVRAVCGIAQPDGLRQTLAQLGARVVSLQAHGDHHAYSEADVQALDAALAAAPGAAATQPQWITTEKDAVKLAGRIQGAERLWVLEMEVLPDTQAQAFFFDFITTRGLQ